jgi:hypothetical protein
MNISKLIRLIALAGAISLSESWAATAQGLTIGAVKKQVPTSFCEIYLPGGEKPMVILLQADDRTFKNALVHVDGRDVAIKRTSYRSLDKIRSLSVYKGKNLTVTIDLLDVRVRVRDGRETRDTTNRVTFKRGKLTETIQSKGACPI